MFYTPIWEYAGFSLLTRPDTANYYIGWYHEGSRRWKRRSTSTSDLDEAKRELIRWAEQRGRPKNDTAENVEILTCLDAFVARKRAKAWRWTAEATAQVHWHAFLKKEGVVRVADLTLGLMEQFVEWRRAAIIAKGRKGSNGSINRDLSVMKAALRDAWKRGHLVRVPYVLILPKPPPRQRVLSEPEIKRLLLACDPPHLELFILITIFTLQRPGAIFALRVEQVDLERGVIDFRSLDEPVSNKRKSVIWIAELLRPHLELALRESVTGYVIEHNGLPVQSIKRSFATACKLAALDNTTPNTLRHSLATLLAEQGVSARAIADMMGHTTTTTTEHNYIKPSLRTMVSTTQTLSALLDF